MAFLKFSVGLILLVSQLISFSQACSCFFRNFETSFYEAEKQGTPFTRAKVISSYVPKDDGPISSTSKKRYFKLRVDKVFSGCVRTTPYYVYASSPISSATCGINLSVGKTYILELRQKGISSLSLCGTNVEVSKLTEAQQKFLDTRYLCCGKTCRCGNSTIVNCLVAPCTFAKPPCKDAEKCVDNFCGGCNAEWFTSEMLPAC